jgi:hypothetical protein
VLTPDNRLDQYWTTAGNWQVDDKGVVSLTPREGEKGWSRWNSYLWLKEVQDDFEVSFEYQVPKNGNSGFFFNVADRNNPVNTGLEVQIFDSASRGPDAKLNSHDSGGIIPGIPPKSNAAKPAGEWNQFHIKLLGDKLTVSLNGQVVNEVDLGTRRGLAFEAKKGFVGFQDNARPISLRNLQLKAL